MSELDDKLNQILSNPDTMNQIMSIANSLSAGGSGNASSPAEPTAPVPSGGTPDLSALTSLLGSSSGVDPKLMGALSQLMEEYAKPEDEKAALLQALKPFLREERSARVDRVIQLTRLSRVVRLALQLFRKEGGNV
jgi:hypothetical protein